MRGESSEKAHTTCGTACILSAGRLMRVEPRLRPATEVNPAGLLVKRAACFEAEGFWSKDSRERCH